MKEIEANKEPDPGFDNEEISGLLEEERQPLGILYEHPQGKDAFVVLITVLLCLAASLVFWSGQDFKNLLWASKERVFEHREYWRVFTALLTHSDPLHLLSNLPLFVVFGWFLRTYFGFLAFPLTAFLAGALANIATLYCYPATVRLIGASGIVYALVGLWITFYLRYEVRYSFRMKLFRVVGFSMMLLFPTTYSPTTSYLAHAFGFLFGVLLALVLIATGIYDKRQKALQQPVKTQVEEIEN